MGDTWRCADFGYRYVNLNEAKQAIRSRKFCIAQLRVELLYYCELIETKKTVCNLDSFRNFYSLRSYVACIHIKLE